MDKFPLLWENRPAGELSAERDGPCTWFTAQCQLPKPGLWCAWVVGEAGELRLGLLERSGDSLTLRRRFSQRMTQPLGRLLRGELRPAGKTAERPPAWDPAPQPESLFSSPPWPRERLRGTDGALFRREGGRLLLALPYDPGRPFPLALLFCFARIQTIRGSAYAVYAFGSSGEPVFL